MSSKLYFHSSSAAAGPTASASTDTDSFSSVPSDKNTALEMLEAKGSSQVSVSGIYNSGSSPLYTLARIWVGPAMAAQTLTGGQSGYAFAMGATESGGNMNLYLRWFAYIWRLGSGNVKTVISPISDDAEVATSETGYVTAATGASGDYSILADDRLVVELWFDIRNTKSTNYTATGYYEGTTDPVDASAISDAASYFECPQTLNYPAASVCMAALIEVNELIQAGR